MNDPDPFPRNDHPPAVLGLRKGVVELRAYDPAWSRAGEEERRCVADSLGDLALAVEHVGSTSVPGLSAKPIIDIAVALPDDRVPQSPAIASQMAAAGYIDRGLTVDGGGWLFVREAAPEVRVAHVHLVSVSDPEWIRYLVFRDRLRDDQALRERYAELKRELATRYPSDRLEYTSAKTDFVNESITGLD